MTTISCHRTTLIILFISVALSIAGCAYRPTPEKYVEVVFRFDDYSSTSATDLERQIIDLFSQYQAPITFAVIPFACADDIHDPGPQETIPLGARKIDLLKRAYNAGILDVGLHGYSHQTIREDHYSEFEGMDYDRQLAKLIEGKKYLEEILDAPVSAFIPPWNRYDLNTLKALETAGFSTISADLKGISTEESNLDFLPATCSIAQIRDCVDTARTDLDQQPVVVMLFHEYDFREVDERSGRTTFKAFSALLDWLDNQPDVRLRSIRQVSGIP